jgi:branched-chain amino acid transport system permease protein
VLALDTLIYGLLLILFIIYMPKGILGTLMEWGEKKSSAPSPPITKTETIASRS